MDSQLPLEHGEEMSFEQKMFPDFSKDGHSYSQRFQQEGGGCAIPKQRLVVMSLGLLNAVLLIAAVVTGIYCAKARVGYTLTPDSATAPLIVERNFLRNYSEIVKAKLEAEAALMRERTSHVQVKLEVKQLMTISDTLQSQMQSLQTTRDNLKSNKTVLEENCGRCPQGWLFLKSSCYYFSVPSPDPKKNWHDSRTDCISRGSDLLVINNLEEQQLINTNMPKGRYSGLWWENGFWIGLTDQVTDGVWVWINNVTEVETMYWRSDQPSRSGSQSGNCVAVLFYSDNLRTWYNGNCQSHLLNWICELEPSRT